MDRPPLPTAGPVDGGQGAHPPGPVTSLPPPSDVFALAAHAAWAEADQEQRRTDAGRARVMAARSLRDATPGASAARAWSAAWVAGLAWPDLPEAGAWLSAAPEALARNLALELAVDGSPTGTPAAAATALWATALALAWGRAAGRDLGPSVTGRFLAGSDALWRIGGDTGHIPGGEAPEPRLGPAALTHSLRNLAVAWGLDSAPWACAPDPATTALTGARPQGDTQPMAQRDWSLWAWRVTGQCVGHVLVEGRPARLWCGHNHLCYRAGDLAVMHSDDEFSDLLVARVQRRTMTIVRGAGTRTRTITARRARVQITDQGATTATYSLGPGWELEAERDGWRGRNQNRKLLIRLSPQWRWEVGGGIVVGRGEGPCKASFEVS